MLFAAYSRRSAKKIYFKERMDHRKNSYERRACESVDEGSLSNKK